ncbi:FusB/FusC family EF-G-binding protein [Brevibacillus daliensis]|uniref:FusB/FusC family EF-G-binding protein n=1 Tax=Brevibacillus daliensis TaxID=2892995 RepID=UPI001E29CEA8|nr:FusB/FusC family EF-G-binding protein [Brevibacillus daliensis]
MEPFIRNDQYNFIKAQAKNIVNAYASVNDKAILHAVKSVAQEKAVGLFDDLAHMQAEVISPISQIENRVTSDAYLAQLKPYVIPFHPISDRTIATLFPKVKKLKGPSLEKVNLQEISYLGWIDKGSSKKYMIVEYQDKLVGLQGTFSNLNQKGVCALCNRHEEIGMFVMEVKRSGLDNYVKRGNYICQDSKKCNENITTLDRLHDFVELLTS